MSNAITDKIAAVPDQALSPYRAHDYFQGIRAALPAIEQCLGDALAWHLFAAELGNNEAEDAIRLAVSVYGRHLRPKPPRRSPDLPVPDTAPRRTKPETVVHSRLVNPDA